MADLIHHQRNYDVEYEHEHEEKDAEFPEDEEEDGGKKHPRHIRIALAKSTGSPNVSGIQGRKARKDRRIEDVMRERVSKNIFSTRIIIVSFVANFIYDIIVQSIGPANIVFALFLVVAFILWIWIASYIEIVLGSRLEDSVLQNFMSFIDNNFIMLVVRYDLGVIDALFISSSTGIWVGILVVFAALSLVYIVVYAFTSKRLED